MKYRSPREELDYLTYKDLSSRAARKSAPAAPAQAPAEDKPEIHVHVAMPEVKDTPAPSQPTPKRWKFTHKYDVHNKLTETIAVALKKSGEVFTVTELCAALDELKAVAVRMAQEKVN